MGQRNEEMDRGGVADEVLRRALGSLRDMLGITDADLRFVYLSPSVETVLGYPVDQLFGTSMRNLLHPDERDRVDRLAARGYRRLVGRTVVHRALHADGRVRHLETMVDVLEEGGRFEGLVFNARDVTERIEVQHTLEREAALRGALIELTNELLAVTLDARFEQHALERTIELVPDAQGGSMLLRRDDGDYGFVAAAEFDLGVLRGISLTPRELGRAQPPRVERLQVREREGRLSDEKFAEFARAGRLEDIRVTLSVPLIVGGDLRGYLNLDHFERDDAFDDDDRAIAEAIGAQVAAALQRRMLEHDLEAERARYELLAGLDPLTEVPNRRLFQDRLEQALARARRRSGHVALLFLDLDGFKEVNDRHGHEMGDRVLRRVAARLVGAVRTEDTVARLGGDEFGVLLADVRGSDDAAAVARKLLAALRLPIAANGARVRLGASVGIALFPEHGAAADGLLRAADDAMYRVKTGGKGDVGLAAGEGRRGRRGG